MISSLIRAAMLRASFPVPTIPGMSLQDPPGHAGQLGFCIDGFFGDVDVCPLVVCRNSSSDSDSTACVFAITSAGEFAPPAMWSSSLDPAMRSQISRRALALRAIWPPRAHFVKYKATDVTRLRLPGAFVRACCCCDGGLPSAQCACPSYSSEYQAVLARWAGLETLCINRSA